ncbi:VrrA/YqfQ family protein [Bacillus sp. EB01]|uniref:VrrA/YqfQ family protein n=1 Tax=Bacillus sp. EB01 TaxID=1347086 RepID=UPI00069411CE|nr:VrrA/YqfQ family protein [Bacillus sp. EB01]
MPPFPPMNRQGGMNRPFMGPGRHPFGPGRGFNGPPSPFMGSMSPGRHQGPQGRRGGGLLSRLLGKSGGGQGHTRNMVSAAGNTQSGSFLKTLSNPEAINSFLANTQNVIQTAQSFGPLIEQYGPIIKNLPSMWKLYRGLKNTVDDETPKNEPQQKKKIVESHPIKENEIPKDSEESSDGHGQPAPAQRGGWMRRPNRVDDDRSRPKLFF